ncbi:MAG: L-serine ammonia-lyase, iron-sulfur-dependent subunit beta [Bacteroidota bacterium]
MGDKSSVFDMIGPVMIGPSSSHTAGVVKIGNAALKILGAPPEQADIIFYNSFARTYEGHGSDRAIIAGLLGYKTDDPRIKTAFDHAKEVGFKYNFRSVGNASLHHPNTVKMVLKSDDRTVEVIGESIGGGVINISRVDGFTANFSASLHTLIIKTDDRQGAIGFIANILAEEEINIATMSVSRKGKYDLACQFIEMDSCLEKITLQYIGSVKWVKETIYIPVIK